VLNAEPTFWLCPPHLYETHRNQSQPQPQPQGLPSYYNSDFNTTTTLLEQTIAHHV